jgi:hypothetical protein
VAQDSHGRRKGTTYVSREGNIVHPGSRDRRLPSEPSDQLRPEDRIPQGLALPKTQPVNTQSTPLWQDFLNIPVGDYEELGRFVSDNPRIISSSEISLLTNHALVEEKTGHANTARKCIHHAILLKRCLAVERKGPFFKEMSNNQSDTYLGVISDINTVYAGIQVRARGDSNTRSVTQNLANLSITQRQSKVISVSSSLKYRLH